MGFNDTVIPSQLSADAVDNDTIELDENNKISIKDEGVDSEMLSFKTMEMISSETLTATATEIEFTGLDSDTENQYQLILKVPKSSIGNVIFLSVNGDTTTANYRNQRTRYEGSSVLTGQISNSQVGQNLGSSNWNTYAIISVAVVNGYLQAQAFSHNAETTNARVELYAITKTAAITKITSLGIYSSNTDGLPVGSVVELYKVGA
jgi:hypothetical protein